MKDRRRLIRNRGNVVNSFCATGEGGGIDPSCSPEGKATADKQDPLKTGILSSLPQTEDEAWALATAAREHIIGDESSCAVDGDCMNAADQLGSLHPDIERWYGNYDGEMGHDIVKAGDWFIDVTSDQFGDEPITVFAAKDLENSESRVRKYWGFQPASKRTTFSPGNKGLIETLSEFNDTEKMLATNHLTINPAVSEAQRRYLNATFGHDWVKEHDFDNEGKLPEKAKKKSKATRNRERRRAVIANRKKKSVGPNKMDPTRTITMRRAFAEELGRKFASLKRAIVEVIADEDALGLKEREPLAFNYDPDQPRDEHGRFGSGVTEAISSHINDSSRATSEEKQRLKSAIEGSTTEAKVLHRVFSTKPSWREGDVIDLPPTSFTRIDITTGQPAGQIGWKSSDAALALIESPNRGLDVSYKGLSASSGGAFSQEAETIMAGRYRVKEVRQVTEPGTYEQYGYRVPQYVLEEIGPTTNDLRSDVRRAAFATDTNPTDKLTVNAATDWDAINAEADRKMELAVWGTTTANARDWAAHQSSAKVQLFQEWLKTQIKAKLTSQQDEQLWAKYAEAGYRKGAGRAFDDVKAKAKAQSYGNQGKLDFYDGTKDQFLRSSFAQPVAVDKVKLLAGRSFDDLENVTADMSTRMSRTLTDGLVMGQSPREIASELAEDADLSHGRALVIARTEIIRAHAEGQLDALETLGVEEVGVAVEFSTTGDGKVCEDCESLEGVVLKIDEARGVIPVHPNCRCAFIPANVGEDDADQKDTKKEIDSAFDDAGLDVEVSKQRPESIINELDPLARFSELLATNEGWVTLGDASNNPGQHVYVGKDGSFQPKGPKAEGVNKAKAKGDSIKDHPFIGDFNEDFSNLKTDVGFTPMQALTAKEYDAWDRYQKGWENKGLILEMMLKNDDFQADLQTKLRKTFPSGYAIVWRGGKIGKEGYSGGSLTRDTAFSFASGHTGFESAAKGNLSAYKVPIKDIVGIGNSSEQELFFKTDRTEIVGNFRVLTAFDPLARFSELLANVFCPTGPGGGIDATCSPLSLESSAVQDSLKLWLKTMYHTVKGNMLVNPGRESQLLSVKKVDVADLEHPEDDYGWMIHKQKNQEVAKVYEAGKDPPPPIVEPIIGKPGKYKVVDGNHRLEGAKIAGRDGLHVIVVSSMVENTFCPTGPGGGIDPSCSFSSGGSKGPSVTDFLMKKFDELPTAQHNLVHLGDLRDKLGIGKETFDKIIDKARREGKIILKRGEQYGRKLTQRDKDSLILETDPMTGRDDVQFLYAAKKLS